VQEMSDQDVTNRYAQEMLKLKTLNQFGRHSERFLGYPNTLTMNRCRRELERRGLPVQPVNPAGKDEGNVEHRWSTPGKSSVSDRKGVNT
jgi:hypothetical protein